MTNDLDFENLNVDNINKLQIDLDLSNTELINMIHEAHYPLYSGSECEEPISLIVKNMNKVL